MSTSKNGVCRARHLPSSKANGILTPLTSFTENPIAQSNQQKIKLAIHYLNEEKRYYFENLVTSTSKYRESENTVSILC